MYDIIGPHNHWSISKAQFVALIVLLIWETVWKIIACWKAAKRDQRWWFVVMAIINTAGLLEIIYIVFFQKKQPQQHTR